MIVLVEDKQNDIKQKFFYDNVPDGGKIRVFGSVTKPDANPITSYRSKKRSSRCWPSIQNNGAWTGLTSKRVANTSRRLDACGNGAPAKWVNYGHRLGYFMSFYCIDGYTDSENQGWDKDYRFASHDAALQRGKALIQAKADFISTDQYEDVATLIHNRP